MITSRLEQLQKPLTPRQVAKLTRDYDAMMNKLRAELNNKQGDTHGKIQNKRRPN